MAGMVGAMKSLAEAYSLPLAFRIIGYGCLLFVAVPCWVGIIADMVGWW